jgi:very-short-patch-repair endonuclease
MWRIRRAADWNNVMAVIGKTDKAELFSFYWKLIASDLPEPEAEYNFDGHIGRKHRFDFAFPLHLVAVEIEGNAWNVKGGGKHMQERDLEKYNIAASLGWRILRFSPTMLKRDPDTCIGKVVEALEWNSTKSK